MRIAYLDCFSGISGDMLLGALVDAGLSLDALRAELASLPAGGYELAAERVARAGIAATKVDVVLADQEQPHRRLNDVLAIIDGSRLTAPDKDAASRIFRRLAQAEGQVHGLPARDVHFHEVGAIDAIVDITGAVVGLRMLGVEALYCSPLAVGSGSARSAHGRIPAPGPATMLLLAGVGAPLRDGSGEPTMELVTPTGAAIVAELADFSRPAMRLLGVGSGAGTRDIPGRPNILRLFLGDTDGAAQARTMLLVETNIDDMPGEAFGYVQERLLAAGAADVWFTPIQMKKNRPAVLLSALCRPDLESTIVALILSETSTLGMRVQEVRRHEAAREIVRFTSSLGPAAVKVKRLPGHPPRIAPEYDDCRDLALEHGLPIAEVYAIVAREVATEIGDG
ncbi:MAG: nickel pincer cofactor biosynthesis protein LarC [Dehalococcoidia bacterium]